MKVDISLIYKVKPKLHNCGLKKKIIYNLFYFKLSSNTLFTSYSICFVSIHFRFHLCPAADRDTSDAVPVTSTLTASVLDPRHKSMAFVARATREAVIAELRDELPPRPPKWQRLSEDVDEDRPSTSSAH